MRNNLNVSITTVNESSFLEKHYSGVSRESQQFTYIFRGSTKIRKTIVEFCTSRRNSIGNYQKTIHGYISKIHTFHTFL